MSCCKLLAQGVRVAKARSPMGHVSSQGHMLSFITIDAKQSDSKCAIFLLSIFLESQKYADGAKTRCQNCYSIENNAPCTCLRLRLMVSRSVLIHLFGRRIRSSSICRAKLEVLPFYPNVSNTGFNVVPSHFHLYTLISFSRL